MWPVSAVHQKLIYHQVDRVFIRMDVPAVRIQHSIIDVFVIVRISSDSQYHITQTQIKIFLSVLPRLAIYKNLKILTLAEAQGSQRKMNRRYFACKKNMTPLRSLRLREKTGC